MVRDEMTSVYMKNPWKICITGLLFYTQFPQKPRRYELKLHENGAAVHFGKSQSNSQWNSRSASQCDAGSFRFHVDSSRGSYVALV